MANLMQKARYWHTLAQQEIRDNPGDMALIIIALYIIAVVSIIAAVL